MAMNSNMASKVTLFAAVAGSQVDREAGILRGVSVITEGDAKGHGMIVDSVTLEQVKACAETYVDGLRVKMDHYTGIDAMVGVLRDFRIDGIQLRADLHLIKSHKDFEKILEMAETIPGSFGLSISFSGECEDVEMPDEDAGEVEPNSGELPEGATQIVRAARCMEIYSADLVDQPAANPSGLFSEKLMSEETAPAEVPAEAPVEASNEEPKVEEIAPEVVADEVKPSEESSEKHSDESSEVALQVDGPAGTQNLPEEKKEVAKAPVAPVASEKEEPVEKIGKKLSAVVSTFETQKQEVITLRADLETAHRNLAALKSEVEKRDFHIAKLEERNTLTLRAAGLLPSDVEVEIAPEATAFDPVAAYHSAVEAGDKVAAAKLFKAHKAAIFAARRAN